MTGGSGLGLPVTGERFRLEAAGPGAIRVVEVASGRSAGVIELEIAGGEVTVRSCCVDPARRGYGAGSEAMMLLIHACATAGVGAVRAWAPGGNGLAVYFWVRMGLRPVFGEGPDGGIWFERRLG
jgi:hypothetical protein